MIKTRIERNTIFKLLESAEIRYVQHRYVEKHRYVLKELYSPHALKNLPGILRIEHERQIRLSMRRKEIEDQSIPN